MTKQEIFNKVAAHLIAQNEICMSVGKDCLYRSRDGKLKCAIGCLIPDDLYMPEFESQSVRGVLSDSPALTSLLMNNDPAPAERLNLLGSLQAVHDNGRVEYWPEGLRTVAHSYGLTIPAVIKELNK